MSKKQSKRKVVETKQIKQKVKLPKELIIFGVAILVMIIGVTGASMAIFSHGVTSNQTDTVQAGTLTIAFTDRNLINLSNAYPMTDAQGTATTPYSFTITNNGTLKAKYNIYLEEDTSIAAAKKLDKTLIKFSYQKASGSYSTPALLSTLGSSLTVEQNQTLNSGASITYNFKFWLINTATNAAQGKTYKAKIVVDSVPTT